MSLDTELPVDALQELVRDFKAEIRYRTGKTFPDDPVEQLWGAIGAVFGSWMNDRAKVYRQLNGIPESWGTAVNVQSMVFGNLGDDCGTGVAFTRVEFCHRLGLDYVSCSPFRIPITRSHARDKIAT